MAVRVQNLSNKNFDERSVHSGSHVSVGFQPWWNSKETETALFLPQNMSLEEETPSKLYKPKHLDPQKPDQESTSFEVIGQSCPGKGVKGGTGSPFYSSESGQAQSCGKDVDGQMKPLFSINNPNTVFSPSHPNYNHSMAPAQYPYADSYSGGLFTPYGQPAFAQMGGGSAPARILLPLDLAEDGPIYVNAKQYSGILRRRQHRAKLEAQNKLVKSRKPYLHESRHRHALNRVRGPGGRFLSKKKLIQPPNPTFNLSSCSISDASCLDRMNNGSELESYSRVADCSGSSTSCSDISSVSNNNGTFQQLKHGFIDISPGVSSMCNGIRHYASVAL